MAETSPRADWDTVQELERQRIESRRRRVVEAGCSCSLQERHKNGDGARVGSVSDGTVGLALSGGGIRSATFSLGLLRSLSRAKLVHRIDYLSTVSGGGYAGSFFCSLFVPKILRGHTPQGCEAHQCNHEASQRVEALTCDVLGSDEGRRSIAQLRQGGHYLAPNGTSDAIYAAVIGIRNWFAIAIVTGLTLLALFLFVNVGISALQRVLDSAEGIAAWLDLAKDQRDAWKVVLTALVFWPASCAWAYWFARSGRVPQRRLARLFSVQLFVAVLIFALAYLWPGDPTGWHRQLRQSIIGASMLSFLVYATAQYRDYVFERARRRPEVNIAEVDALIEEDRVRETLSRWLLRGALVWAAVAAIAGFHQLSMIDFGDTVIAARRSLNLESGQILIAAALVAIVLPIGRWLVRREEKSTRTWRGRAYSTRGLRQAVSLVLGVLLLAAFITFWAAMAGGVSRWVLDGPVVAWENLREDAAWLVNSVERTPLGPLITTNKAASGEILLLLLASFVALVSYLLGNVDAFLNRSSFSAFYGARLRTAYLGATNPARWTSPSGESAAPPPPETDAPGDGNGKAQALPEAPRQIEDDHLDDEIALVNYYADSVLAPIHLVNVTVNETTSKSSRVVQRDRKGKLMTVTPYGYLYPEGAPSEGLSVLKHDEAETLPLSSWMAISGAAFTTGAGHHTSLGTAMLACLGNVRLGYWWWRKPSVRSQWHFRSPRNLVQFYLMRELRASYEGTEAERWYLSDGGHYENTGIYELVRRRVPLIIASDNGADRHYEFADLVNLIRKIRIDFGAEIRFLDQMELDHLFHGTPLHEAFGTLEVIRESGKAEIESEKSRDDVPAAGPYATLARISYPASGGAPEQTSTLLLIKPRIAGRELPDLIQYRATNAAFPQQPTTNQFFDEAQWESYYRLGQLIGDRVFDQSWLRSRTKRPGWEPWTLEPLPPEPETSVLADSQADRKAPQKA